MKIRILFMSLIMSFMLGVANAGSPPDHIGYGCADEFDRVAFKEFKDGCEIFATESKFSYTVGIFRRANKPDPEPKPPCDLGEVLYSCLGAPGRGF